MFIVPAQRVRRTKVQPFDRLIDDDFGENSYIPQTKIETLAGERVDAVSRVASQRDAVRRKPARHPESQREGGGLLVNHDLAEPRGETLTQSI